MVNQVVNLKLSTFRWLYRQRIHYSQLSIVFRCKGAFRLYARCAVIFPDVVIGRAVVYVK